MNQKLLEQLALAEEAGDQAMAKDFFAKPENEAAEGAEGEMPMAEGAAPMEGESPMPVEGEGEMTPEQLEELLAMLGQEGE